jgi:hypothetical protein
MNNLYNAIQPSAECNRGRGRYRNRNRERKRPMPFGHEKPVGRNEERIPTSPPFPSARRSPLAGDALDFTAETQSAQRDQGRCGLLLCVLCVSAVNRRSLGGDAALAGGPLDRPQAGSYVVSTRWLVGARLRATRWISPQKRRVRKETKVDAALFSALSGSLR